MERPAGLNEPKGDLQEVSQRPNTDPKNVAQQVEEIFSRLGLLARNDRVLDELAVEFFKNCQQVINSPKAQ